MSKEDPVRSYAVVRLWSGVFLEAVELAAAPKQFQFLLRGTALGEMREVELPRPASWWQRFVGGRRLWEVLLHGETIGTIELEYPVGKKSRLFLQLNNSTALPLGLASRWRKKETRFVIPPDTPNVGDPELETLHFLLGVLFRTVIVRVDSCD